MKSIILCAGFGERLKPLTNRNPKVMLKIGKKPLLEHQIKLLKKHGFPDIAINLHHLPGVIKNYFKTGKKWKVKITYSYEPTLLGTAGAVKKLETFFKRSPILIHYGDNLTNINLSQVKKFHESKKSPCTIALYESEEPWTMGTVELGKENRVKKFVEKPKKKNITTNWVSAGTIFLDKKLLSYIPKNKYFDFGKDFFPLLLKKNIPIYALKTNAYVQDVGNLRRYKKAYADFQKGLIKI